jgi:hypothetical protein
VWFVTTYKVKTIRVALNGKKEVRVDLFEEERKNEASGGSSTHI